MNFRNHSLTDGLTNKMRLLCVLFVGLSIVGCGHTGHAEEQPAPVTVAPSGTFRGSRMTSRKGRQIEAYRNIRYAEAPIEALRFEEPRPITKYFKVVDASNEGPSCPQPVIPESPGYMDEDCLKLNVYTHTKNRTNLLPVVVFINYGAFYVSSGRSDVVGPRYLLDHDLVLVTFNSRLGSLGYLSTGDKLAPGNNGFKDQVVVLQWVQKNIAAFGGNPGSVTLLGCGSGSYSATLHMISPMSTGLFHRVLSLSGSPFSQVKIGNNQYDLAVKQAQLLNCPTENSEVIIDCLKSKSSKEIGNSLNGFIGFQADRSLYWTVVVENDFGQNRFMPYDPLDAVRSGKLYSVPYIVSQTQDEYAWLANAVLSNATLTRLLNEKYIEYAPKVFQLPKGSENEALKLRDKYLNGKELKNDKESAERLRLIFGDAITGFSGHRLANLMCRNSDAPVYYYEFAYIGNNSFYRDPDTKEILGAAHHDDLIYLFSMPGLFPDIGLTGPDAEMVDTMTAIIYVFAKFGNPNSHEGFPELSQLSWPAMTAENRSYIRISNDFSVRQNLKEERFQLWDSLFQISYAPKSQKTKNHTHHEYPGIIPPLLEVVGGLVKGILG